MPNWCANDMVLKHRDPAMIERAITAFREGRLLDEFIPMPKELRESNSPERDEEVSRANIEKYGASSWYDWAVNNWGTKWDIGGEGEPVEQTDPNSVTMRFDSAWAPPIAAFRILCARGFEVDAYYNEPGMAFCGHYVGSEDGDDDDYREYSDTDSETVREVIGDDLDDHWGISEMLSEWERDSEETE